MAFHQHSSTTQLMRTWTEQTIADMIKNQVEESSRLEWKRSDALIEVPKRCNNVVFASRR